MTALSVLSKPDTALLLEPNGGGAAALIVDGSELRTNLTNAGTYASEAASARTALATPRTVTVVVDMTSASSGYFVHHGSAAAVFSYALLKSTTNLRVAENNAVLFNVTIPGLAVTARKILVHWAQRVEGASVLSECYLFNFATSEWAYGSLVHAATVPNAAHTLTVGAGFGGASAYSLGVTAFYKVVIGRRYHSGTEANLDFVTTPTPPVMTGRRRKPLPTGSSAALAITGDGQFAGPQYLHALAATRVADSRLLTPLVNLMIANPYSEVVTPTARYHRTAPGAPAYRLSTRWLWHAVPSPKCNAARVRVHVAVTGTGSVCPIYLRLYSIANLPMGQQNPPPLDYSYTTTAASIVASTGAAGVWKDLGTVRLVRDASGMTLLALAINFNNGLGDIYSTNVKIRAVTVEPYSADLSGGGFGDVDEKDGF